MLLFLPSFTGSHRVESLPDDFITRLAARVEKGLLPVAPARRNRYEVTERTDSTLPISIGKRPDRNHCWSE